MLAKNVLNSSNEDLYTIFGWYNLREYNQSGTDIFNPIYHDCGLDGLCSDDVGWPGYADYGEGNYAGTGEAATVSSDAAGFVDYDTELITPFISTDGFKNVAVQYNALVAQYNNEAFGSTDTIPPRSTSKTIPK